MDFFETPEQVASQLDEARQKLKDFEENADSSVLMGRLRNAAPFHPTLLARALFLILALTSFLAAIGIVAYPFVMGAVPKEILQIEKGIGVPLPVPLGLLALCLTVAWFGAGQAALAFARDCALMPSELKEHERLLNEVKRLSSQKAIMDRVRGTPMGARPRTATPAPSVSRGLSPVGPPTRGTEPMRTATPSPRSERTYTPPVAQSRSAEDEAAEAPTPEAAPARPGVLPSRPPSMRAGSLNSQRPSTNAQKGPTPAPVARTAGGPASRIAKASSAIAAAKAEELSKKTPPTTKRGLSPIDVKPTLDEMINEEPDPQDEEESDTPVHTAPSRDYIAAEQPQLNTSVTQSGFEQRYATHFPKWGTVDEPWLEDAIQKSEILATGFPVQAHLQYSAEPNVPFTLVLERATPAMAVRAMVSFIEFLASVATPPRARIVMRSVPHLDRSFHRNVEAALEPYFRDKAQVIREPDRIEIKFLEWDVQWKDHPYLPIEG
jgi:hypothetical protein